MLNIIMGSKETTSSKLYTDTDGYNKAKIIIDTKVKRPCGPGTLK